MKISFFKHSELSNFLKFKIIDLKNQHWEYSPGQHLDWLNNNLNEDDYHLLISDEKDDAIAYLNLVNVKLIRNNQHEELVLGIGNVCVDKFKEKKGLGLLIMNVANYYLKKIFKQGILLCNDTLVSFYEKAGWKLFDGEFFINNKKGQIALMTLFQISDEILLLNKSF
jgi:predicted GNAT family N-acyltransferase